MPRFPRAADIPDCRDQTKALLRRPVEPGQFTSDECTQVLKDHGIQISMDGRGRWIDNVFIERLWKSVKYEEVYLHGYESVAEAKQQLARYFSFYNTGRPHSSLGGQTPDAAYFDYRENKAA